MSEDAQQPAWQIAPHLNPDFDSCVIFVADDPEGKKAMEYAQQVIFDRWDNATLAELDITVSIKRTMVNPIDVDDGE